MSIIQNTMDPKVMSSAQDIIEYARLNKLINLAENHSELSGLPQMEEQLQKYIVPYANVKPPKYGLRELREAISKKAMHQYDCSYNAESEITITSGVKQSVFLAILALVKEGDEVVIFEPSYQSYRAAIEIVGARPVFVSLKAPTFEIDWADVQKVIKPNTKMIILNSPHYPTGGIMSELDMLRLQKVITGTNIIILSDETFEHLIFDSEMHQSAAMFPKLKKQSVIISSFNETLLAPYWNVSYCMAPEKLMKEIRKVLGSISDGISLPFQMAIKDFFDPTDKYKPLAQVYQAKRDLVRAGLEDSNVTLMPSKGSYFQLICIDAVTSKYDQSFALELMENFGLATMPISFYYHQKSRSKYLRINLSVPDDVILDAVTILKSLPAIK